MSMLRKTKHGCIEQQSLMKLREGRKESDRQIDVKARAEADSFTTPFYPCLAAGTRKWQYNEDENAEKSILGAMEWAGLANQEGSHM